MVHEWYTDFIDEKGRELKSQTIYRLYNTIDGKSYIGQTGNIKERIYHHFNSLRKQFHWNPGLTEASRKYGVDAFQWEVLEVVSIQNADNREHFWMTYFKKQGGVYNAKQAPKTNGHLSEQLKRGKYS